jgi:adenine-specific DNA-methyltransferase
MYFTSENAAKIDAISLKISSWYEDGLISEKENSLLRHDLILAANKVANIAGTYGHYRSKWSNGSTTSLKLVPATFLKGFSTKHTVMQGPAEEISKKVEAELCYLDPPYMKRQYAANYHIIETLARGDVPEAIGVSGLRPWRDQYSNFCSKVKIRDSFRQIFENIDCRQFLISYSEDGLLSEKEMTILFKQFGKVSLKKIPIKRFKSNTGGEGGTVLEYLYHVRT